MNNSTATTELTGIEYYKQWQEVNALISKYDWAVEGFNAPESETLSREAAKDLRNQLVELASKIGAKF